MELQVDYIASVFLLKMMIIGKFVILMNLC